MFNRRGFQERLQAIAEDPEARRKALSVVTCDLDHFKSINDTYGHTVGDKVIAAFADTLARAAAGRYLVARIGGEEFAVLLPDATVSAARQFAEQVRIAFAVRAIDGLEKGASVTASFGVAERADGEHWSDLLDRADRALYAAKRDGRDCVRLA
ncbi:MAG: GGDEF domain-containing protein, partial [Phycisphaerales bacterium]|nr:GGDEF domain-containing protein [Phycisphaerales bacterium]